MALFNCTDTGREYNITSDTGYLIVIDLYKLISS